LALQNAASVAGLLLTTEAMVSEAPKGLVVMYKNRNDPSPGAATAK